MEMKKKIQGITLCKKYHVEWNIKIIKKNNYILNNKFKLNIEYFLYKIRKTVV